MILLACAPAAAEELPCGASPCSAAQFVTRLLQVADEVHGTRVAQDFERAFGSELTRHTSVLISEPIEGAQKNGVARFVRLGDEKSPLRFGASEACVTFTALERALTADGWDGGPIDTPAAQGAVLRYLKGRTQLTAARVPRPTRQTLDCAASIVITYRAERPVPAQPLNP
jgi:hypothetical protein